MARKKKEVKKEEVSRKEINGLVFVTYDDGSVEITMAPITLTKEQVEDIFGETEEAEEDEEEEETENWKMYAMIMISILIQMTMRKMM